jgi:methyl-accepting chemotaxis protein
MSVRDRFEWVRRRYARKFALMALVLVIVIAGIGLFTQGQVSGQVVEQRQTDVQTSAQLEANALGQWLQGSKQQVRTLSNHAGLRSDDPEAVQSTLRAELEQMPEEVMALHYVDRDDRTVLASTTSSLTGQSLNETDIFWNPNVGFTFSGTDDVVESFVYRTGDKSAVALASPVPDSNRVVVSIVRTDVRAEQFSSSIDGTRTVAVGGFTGLVLFAENSSVLLESYHGETNSTLEERATGPDGKDNGSFVTGEHVVGYASVPSTDWLVVKEAPKGEALAIKSRIEGNLMLLIGSALVGLIVLGALTARGPMRSLRQLSTQARAIADGDLSQEIPDENRIDEVGQVRTAFRETKDYLDTVADQADALADQEFDADVFDERVPGRLGDSFVQMREDLQGAFDDLEAAKQSAERSRKEAEALAEELEEAKETVEAEKREAERSRKEAEALADDLQGQAEEVRRAVEAAAEGDLTVRLATDQDRESMAAIATAFNDLLAELETTIGHLQDFASTVDGTSEELATNVAQIEDASQQVSETVQGIATRADRSNENVQQVSQEMSDLSATIEEIASSATNVAKTAEAAAQEGNNSKQAAEATISMMEELEAQAAATVQEINELNEEMDEIGEIVELIEDIAEQTNMLALNASIEAAQAEGDGDGFAVVADEIKTLANETAEATGEIDALISTVQDSTESAVDDIEEMQTRVDDGAESVETTLDALENMNRRVEDVNTRIQSIDEATDEQASSTEAVVTMVDEVSETTDETAGDAGDAAAATEEQSATITDVSDRLENLSRQSTELRDRLAQFQVDGTDGPGTGARSHEARTGTDGGRPRR